MKKWKKVTCILAAVILASTALPLPTLAGASPSRVSVMAKEEAGPENNLEIAVDEPAEIPNAGGLEEVAGAIPLKEGNNRTRCGVGNKTTVFSFTPEKTKNYLLDLNVVDKKGYTGYGFNSFWYYDENNEKQEVEGIERIYTEPEYGEHTWETYPLEQGTVYYYSISIDLGEYATDDTEAECIIRIAEWVTSWHNFQGNGEYLEYEGEMTAPQCTVYGEDENGSIIHEELNGVFDWVKTDDPSVLTVEEKDGVYTLKSTGVGSTDVTYTASAVYKGEKVSFFGHFRVTISNELYRGDWQVNGVSSYRYYLVPGQELQAQFKLDRVRRDSDGEKITEEVSPEDYRVTYTKDSVEESVLEIKENGVIRANELGECQISVDFYMDGRHVDGNSFYVEVKEETSAASLYKLTGQGEEKLVQMPPCSESAFSDDILISAHRGDAVKLVTKITTYTEANLDGTETVCANPILNSWSQYESKFSMRTSEDGVITISDIGDWGNDLEEESSFYGEIKSADEAGSFYIRIDFEDVIRTEGDYQYSVRAADKAQITKYLGTKAKVKVPSQIAGKNVIGIGKRAFQNCATLTQLELPESVVYIGEDAFDGCVHLELIVKLGSYAEAYAKENGIAYKYINHAEIQAAKKALDAVRISRASATLYTGKVSHTVTLKPNYPKNFMKTLQKAGLSITSVAYKSSSPQKASVTQKGKVTGLKAGSVTITTTVALSNGIKKELRTKITVKKPYLEISGKKSVKKGKTLTLKVKKYGVSGAASWSVDKKKLASIHKKTGKLTAKAAGTVKVTVKVGNVKTTWKAVIKK